MFSAAFYRSTRGLGDAVMLTGTVASWRRIQERRGREPRLTVAVGKELTPVFLHHPSVDEIVPAESFDPSSCDRVFDCSNACAVYESENQPKVLKSRPRIWLETTGETDLCEPPRLHLTLTERLFAAEWRARLGNPEPLVGVGWQSAERWRNYPYMDALVKVLRNRLRAHVVIFSKRQLNHGENRGVSSEANRSLRELFSMISACDVVVSPDTAHVHIAAALGVPTYGIFGPTDGLIRLSDYDSPFELPEPFLACGRQPCWYQPCRERWCLTTLSPNKIADGIASLLDAGTTDRTGRKK